MNSSTWASTITEFDRLRMRILAFPGCANAYNSVRPEVEIFIGLADKGHDVTVMIPEDSNALSYYQAAGINVIFGYPKRKICFETIKTLRNELKTHDYDVVYATNSKTIPNAAFACIGLPVKLVAYRGTTGGLYRHDPSAYLTILHPRVDGVICVSEAVRQDILQQAWKGKDQVVTIHKGHNLAWYDHKTADLSEFGIKETDFTAVCACNVRPSKGIEVMLTAAEQLTELANVHLLLVGKGLDQEPYRSLIAKHPMKDRIHVTGYRKDAPEIITACDVLVQPSISGEGLPRTVMEAMSCGTPTIVTTTGGGKEVVLDGISGFVIPVKDADKIAEKIRFFHSNPQAVTEFGRAGKTRLANQFSTKNTVDKFEQYFQQL